MWRTIDGGATWHEINKGILYKEIWSLAQHPLTGELFAGSSPPSIFKSRDGGDTWADCAAIRKLEDSLHWTFPPPPHIAHVKDITLREDDTGVIYAAIEEGWVIRSTDAGSTWETLKHGVSFDSHSVTVMPGNPSVLLVTSGEGLYRSENGGEKFVRSDTGIVGGFMGRGYMGTAAVHKARPDVVFTGAADAPPPFWFTRKEGAKGAFYRSDDAGKTWARLEGPSVPEATRGAPRSTFIDPEDPDRVIYGMTDGSVWMSEDAGRSFRLIAEGLPGWIAAITFVSRGPLLERAAAIPVAAPGQEAASDEAKVGETYEVTILNEIDVPMIGANGVSMIGDADVRIPNAKKGEQYSVKVISVGVNAFTKRKEAIIQKLSGPRG
jgi:photosystem II stability/assembly factor-like uncharacterized protein